MEQYIVSARKYRPAHFDQVVGQGAITSTLKNALANDHLAQAFLFCGPRGVGKTTCARILARTINCVDLSDKIEACGECEPCKSFDEGHSFNVHELDAASNNSVDDIRNLIDQVRLAPQVGSHKVYIIDEVHMLSTQAFNAFLKTLEEPPAHAIFILATTEKHKIIPTILSRCQIFDFKRIQVNDMAAHLANVAEKEQIKADPDALHLIAQKADGSLRDALSIFDQIVSYSGSELLLQHVLENLNVLDHEYYFKITASILNGDVPGVLLGFDKILDQGFDGHLFLNGLGAHFRDLLVSGTPRTIGLLEVGEILAARYLEQSSVSDPELLIKGLETISQADVKYKVSKDQRLLVELMLIKLCRLSGIRTSSPSIASRSSEKNEVPEEKKTEPEPKFVPEANSPEPIAKSETEVKETPVNTVEEEPMSFEKRPKETEASTTTTTTVAATTKSTTPSAAEKPVVTNKPTATISINSMLATKESTQEEEGEEEIVEKKKGPREPFSQERLEEVWTAYALKRKNAGKNSLHATLMHQSPKLNEDLNIVFTIMNEVQERDLQNEGPELLAFLRNTLKNFGIDVQWKKEEIEHQPLRPVNDIERFKILAKKNPNLLKLKDKLDLQVGH